MDRAIVRAKFERGIHTARGTLQSNQTRSNGREHPEIFRCDYVSDPRVASTHFSGPLYDKGSTKTDSTTLQKQVLSPKFLWRWCYTYAARTHLLLPPYLEIRIGYQGRHQPWGRRRTSVIHALGGREGLEAQRVTAG